MSPDRVQNVLVPAATLWVARVLGVAFCVIGVRGLFATTDALSIGSSFGLDVNLVLTLMYAAIGIAGLVSGFVERAGCVRYCATIGVILLALGLWGFFVNANPLALFGPGAAGLSHADDWFNTVTGAFALAVARGTGLFQRTGAGAAAGNSSSS